MHALDFSTQVVWITGASSGIGEELARQLHARGSRLILSARSTDKLERIRRELGEERISILPMDVSELDGLKRQTEKALECWGRLDILINNAGISQRSSVEDSDLSIDQQIFDVNFFGNIGLTRAVLPHMLERGAGRIVVVSSVVGKISSPFRSAYAASKHALHGWYDALRAEVSSHGIHVHLSCPGYIRTDLSINALAPGGQKHGKMDSGQKNGMAVDQCARKIIDAMVKDRNEVVIGKEWVYIWLRKFLPGVYFKALEKRAVKKAF